MRVLVPSSNLTAVTVEGIPLEAGIDAAATVLGAWEGVEVGLFDEARRLAPNLSELGVVVKLCSPTPLPVQP